MDQILQNTETLKVILILLFVVGLYLFGGLAKQAKRLNKLTDEEYMEEVRKMRQNDNSKISRQ